MYAVASPHAGVDCGLAFHRDSAELAADSPKCAADEIFVVALFSSPRYVNSLSLQGGGHGVTDQSVSRAETLRAMDSGAPLCADAAGASLLEAAPPAQLAASFGCAASGDARCVVLEARHLGRCVLGPPVIQHVATGGRFVIERACCEVCCLTWAARIGGSNLLSASQYLLARAGRPRRQADTLGATTVLFAR